MPYPNELLKDIVYEAIWGTFRHLWEHVDKYEEDALEKIAQDANFFWECPDCGYHIDSYIENCTECDSYSWKMDHWVLKTKYRESPFHEILEAVKRKHNMADSAHEWLLKASLTMLKNQSQMGLAMGKMINLMVNGLDKGKVENVIEELAQIQSESRELVDELQELQKKVAKS